MGKNSLGITEFSVERCEESTSGSMLKWIVHKEDGLTACPKCGCIGPFYRHTKEERIVQDLNHHGFRSFIAIQTGRLKCADCSATFVEEFDCISGRDRITTRMRDDIEQRSIREPFSKIADEYGISVSTVKRCFTDFADRNKDLIPLPTPAVIGLDEAHLYGKMRLVMTDVQNKYLMDIYPNRDIGTVISALKALPDKQDVKVVTMDMWPAYRTAAYTVFPSAKVVVDRFHVIQEVVREMDSVRKRVVPRGSKADHQTSLGLRDIMKANREDLSLEEWNKLQVFCKAYPEIQKAYYIKEGMRKVYMAKSRTEAGVMYKNLRSSVPKDMPEMVKAFSSFDSWAEEIFNFFDVRYTNAFTESTNRKLKDLKQIGRSISFDTLRLKALLADRLAHPAPNYKTTKQKPNEAKFEPSHRFSNVTKFHF